MPREDESGSINSSRLGEVQESARVPIEGYGLALAMSQGGRYMVLGGMVPGQHGSVALLDNAGKLEWRHRTREAISTVAICRSGDYLAIASDDNNIFFFSRSGLLQYRHETGKLVKCLGISDSGDLMVAGGEDGNLLYFDRNRQIKKFVWKYRFEDRVTCAAISSQGNAVAAGSADRTAAYLEGGGQLLWAHEAHDAVNAVAMSSEGGLVAIGSADHSVYLFSGTGIPVSTFDCGAPVTALAMSARGDRVVAAAGKELICMDSQGNRVWALNLGANIVRMAASSGADCVLAATGDNVLYFATKPGVLGWRHSSASPIYAIALSDDGELAACCGPSELRIFETNRVGRELVSRYQTAIGAAKRSAQDVAPLEALLRQAANALAGRSYPTMVESLSDIREQLAALERIAEEREKLRRDTADAVSRMILAVDELRASVKEHEAEAPVLEELSGISERAELAFQMGKYSEALAAVAQVEGLIASTKERRAARTEALRALDGLAAQLQASAELGVDVSAARALLEAARGSLRVGTPKEAMELVDKAAAALSEARAHSPRAMEADHQRALRIISSPASTEAELAEAAAILSASTPFFIEKRAFAELADSYERLASAWARRPRSPETDAAYAAAMLSALYGFLDAGKPERAVAIAKQLGDWTTAAKLLLAMRERERAEDAWARAATAKRPRPSIPQELKERAERYIQQARYLDAAEELARGGFVLEASRVLRREKPEARAVALMLRLLFHLQDFEGILERSREYLPALRREARDSGDSRDLAIYAQVLIGADGVARLLESAEAPALRQELQELVQDYTRALARDELTASEMCDLAVLYFYLTERNWKAVERLAELKGGEFWDHLKSALGAWKEVNIYLFREEIRGLIGGGPVPRHPTQPLPEVVHTGDIHDALSEMAPYNLHLLIFQTLDCFSNRDYLGGLVKRGDASLAAGRDEEAASVYKKALELDTFGLLDTRKINLRLAGIFISRGRDAEAVPHLEAARAGREAALEEYRAMRGLPAPAPSPAPVKKPARAAAPASGSVCPKCGSSIPAKAIRCFRCGASVK
ncbi:MAG: hypothetical protein ACUVV6_04080 [Thermoplasmatota archaeon]